VQPTFTPLPTNTTIPPSGTPLPTHTAVPPTSTPRPTNTPFPTNMPLPTNTASRTSTPYVGPTRTFTPVPFITFAPTASYTPYGVLNYGAGVVTAAGGEGVPLADRPPENQAQAQEFGVGGPVPTLTPYAVAVAPTFTPEQPTFTPFPTETPFPTQPPAVAQLPTLNSQQVMATQIVYEATATTAAQFGLPAPPIPTTMMQPGQVQPDGTVPTPYDQSGGGPVYIYITATPFGATSVCNEYLVAPGDTMYRIASAYGITVNQLAQANNITNADLIDAGDTLQIPCPVPLTPTPVVTPFTADGTGGRAGVYIVQPGDNIYRIALQFNVTMAELMGANGITAATMNSISVGQELIIPASARVGTLTPTPIAGQGGPIYIVITATPTPYGQVAPQPGAAG
jgi:LysM repeat protein